MEDIKVVHYHARDPIQNFKVKVTLTRVTAARQPGAPVPQVST